MRWFLSPLPEVRTGAFWSQRPPEAHATPAVLAVRRSPSCSAPGQGLTRAGRRLTIARASGRGWGPVVGPGAPSLVVGGQHRGGRPLHLPAVGVGEYPNRAVLGGGVTGEEAAVGRAGCFLVVGLVVGI